MAALAFAGSWAGADRWTAGRLGELSADHGLINYGPTGSPG
jgi:hypothetical protein